MKMQPNDNMDFREMVWFYEELAKKLKSEDGKNQMSLEQIQDSFRDG